MLTILEDYDWEEVFKYATPSGVLPMSIIDTSPFTREDVVYIAGIEEGENDAYDWILYGMLNDGRWFYLQAGCDYTGWG